MPKDSKLSVVQPCSSSSSNNEDEISTSALFNKYRKADGTVDFDYFYDNPDEPEVQLECSVVRHMLTQIKIGMDLSKITLPTFILERRSLLEMYADHFSHPQLFVAIADGQTPRERMMAALRWYVSSFHAGRNYDVAKKPYNPILGESFTCYFDWGPQARNSNYVTDGPVPWARDNSLAFYAEQVSHHPPVSAFYAEHVRKRITFNANIWTKSKFYGWSIGVINIGKAIVSVLDHNEQYIFTFPSAFARSIMTVPYVELGGTVTATCPQTGFKADIEFLTKSFYSNKRNRLTCKVYEPERQPASDVIEGDWTGILKIKKSPDLAPNTVFIDVTKIQVHNKIVRPLKDQGPRESRYVWRNVTAALFVNKVGLATKYKSDLEQIQREETTQRKQNNVNYESIKFRRESHEDDSQWWYQPDLSNRLQGIQSLPPK